MASSGVFSESVNFNLHVISSFLIFLTFVPILITVNGARLTIREHNRAISYYGYAVTAIDAILLIAVTSMFMGYGTGIGPPMEWLAVFTYLGWVGILAHNAR